MEYRDSGLCSDDRQLRRENPKLHFWLPCSSANSACDLGFTKQTHSRGSVWCEVTAMSREVRSSGKHKWSRNAGPLSASGWRLHHPRPAVRGPEHSSLTVWLGICSGCSVSSCVTFKPKSSARISKLPNILQWNLLCSNLLVLGWRFCKGESWKAVYEKKMFFLNYLNQATKILFRMVLGQCCVDIYTQELGWPLPGHVQDEFPEEVMQDKESSELTGKYRERSKCKRSCCSLQETNNRACALLPYSGFHRTSQS